VAEEKYLVEKTVMVAVAINGKVRDELEVQSAKCKVQSEMLAEAKRLKKIKKWIEGKKIVKEIYVPGKMINFVVTE